MAKPLEVKSGKVDQLTFDAWEKLVIEGSLPEPRNGHAVAVVGCRVYMFGGSCAGDDDNTVYYGNLLMLNLEETPLCWKVIEQHGDIPSAREGLILCCVREELFLYGGVERDGTYTCAEGLYIFNTATDTWELKETTGTVPRAQSMSGVVHGNRLITFGGVLNGTAQNTVHILDIATLEWNLIETSGTTPAPRCDHACCVVGEVMYLTAGSGSDELWYNDLHTLNLASLAWNQVELEGTPPVARDYTTLNNLANLYLVQFGGSTGASGEDECFSDLTVVDLSGKAVKWVDVSDVGQSPPPRFSHAALIHSSKLYVISGQDNEQEFNDVWALQADVPMTGFEPTPVPRTRYSVNNPIPAPRKTITPAPPQAVKPRDFEELRSNYIKRINEMFDVLTEKFQQLDTATATLESERAAFETEKKAHYELYERQQQELNEMFASHREQNDEWIAKIRDETDSERRALAQERAAAEKGAAELAREQEAFTQKSKKLDAIMRQVQGLKD